MNQINISFWALPAMPTREYYQNKINSLAIKYSSNVFMPHVTIYAGKSTTEESRAILSIFRNKKKITLYPLRVEASAELSKTFYISYQQNEEFQRFQENIKHCMSSPSGYVLSPHMSLLYKEFMDDKYSNLLSGEVVDLYAIQIDEICVVSTPNSFKSIEDIPKWEIQHYIKLNS